MSSKIAHLQKILIANRGEIACRIIRTAKRLGIQTVAVFSDADAGSMHVKLADEAYCIGRPPAQESYLRGEKIIKVAKESNAIAIHPGYGFLSENVEFAELCQKEGVTFIGPPASAIRDMGIKSTSKRIMELAGVSIVPGYHGEEQSISFLKQKAEEIGFPVMIKAVRGGGGKGMRIARTQSDFESALESAKTESIRAFGNDDVLLEKYIERPRHVEVQIFGDKHGNYVYLFERDCSVQRRHQKVIEQAPAPNLSPELRKQLGEAGVKAAKAVNYVGAGTVEFIFDTIENKFYFMEMNTRLQVEHPITEMITGVDLVEWQLKVAAGDKIPKKQDEIILNGCSVEARIYAEDITGGFLPTAGFIRALSVPSGDNIRVETGVSSGDEVSVHYDPMIAKLVIWAEDQASSLTKMSSALNNFNIVGVDNNVDFLRRLCNHNDLIEGNVHTGFIDEHKPALLPTPPSLETLIQAAVCIVLKDDLNRQVFKSNDPFLTEGMFRLNHSYSRNVKLSYDKEYNITIKVIGNNMEVSLENGDVFKVQGTINESDGFVFLTIRIGNKISKTKLALSDGNIYIFNKNGDYKLALEKEQFDDEKEVEKGIQAVSPMPGVIEKIFVKNGDCVKKGDPIAVVIAMKMEHVIKTEVDGKIESVFFKPGDNVGKNVPLVKFEE